MDEDNKKTVVDGRNLRAQSEDDRPTVADGRKEGMDSPTERPMPPTPFQQVYPQPRPTPPGIPYSPPPDSPPPPAAPPSPEPPPADSRTVMMHTSSRETAPLAWLAIVEGVGGARGTVYTLQRETVVGRTSGVLLRDPAVSGQHLKIRLEPSELDPKVEEYVLYDMASANGTFVGDYETCKKEANRVYRYVLHDGLYIQIGKTMLVFKQV